MKISAFFKYKHLMSQTKSTIQIVSFLSLAFQLLWEKHCEQQYKTYEQLPIYNKTSFQAKSS